jgi:hypothetical protein
MLVYSIWTRLGLVLLGRGFLRNRGMFGRGLGQSYEGVGFAWLLEGQTW